MSTHLIEIVERMPRSRVVLVGDLMLDRYLFGNAERLSPEAPVPILHYESEDLRLGGAGNVAACLAALGAAVNVIGLVGQDADGQEIRNRLGGCGCDASRVLRVPGRPTVAKMRLVGYAQHKNPQQLIRLDYEDCTPIDAELERSVVEHFEQAI